MDGEYNLAYIHTVTIDIMEHTWAVQNINIYNVCVIIKEF